MILKPYGGPYEGGVASALPVPTLGLLPRTRPSLRRFGSEFDDSDSLEAGMRYPRARGTVNPEHPGAFEDEITLLRDEPDDFTQTDRVAVALEDKTKMY